MDATPSLLDGLGALSLSNGSRFRFVLMIVILLVIVLEEEARITMTIKRTSTRQSTTRASPLQFGYEIIPLVQKQTCPQINDSGFAFALRPSFIRALNTFDRHLLREWLRILGLVLLATLGLLLAQVMYDDFRHLSEIGARGLDLLLYVFVTIPSFLMIVLPLALLVSLLYVLGQLHRTNEITAMRAAGVGFFRLTRPIWLVGLLCCGLSWWLNAKVVPWSVEKSRVLKENLQYRYQANRLPADQVGAVTNVAFDNAQGQRLWFLNRYSGLTRRGYGVTVSILDRARHESSRLLATEAWRDETRGGWVFKNGRELAFKPETGELMSSVPFAEKWRTDFDEDPQLMLLLDRRPIDLSFFELRRARQYFEADRNPKGVPYAIRYHGMLADTLSPLIVIAIAIPFAMAGVRVNPAVGVSKSIGLFFLYYVLANVAASLATKEFISPELAAWLPNIGMTALGGWLFARLR